MKTKSRSFFLILLLALGLRIAWALAVPVQPLSDGSAYDVLAQNLVNGGGFGFQPGAPTAHWPPGTSFVYALFYLIFGHTYLPIVILNTALGVLIVAAAMELAEWWFNSQVSLVAGLLLALWFNLIEFTTLLASELIFCALLLWALRVWMHPRYGWLKRAIGAGVLLAAWLDARISSGGPSFKRSLTAVVVLGIVMALVIVPWSIRNIMTLGKFILISDNGGEVLWNGNNVASDSKSLGPVPQLFSTTSTDQDAYQTSLVLEYTRSHPLDFAIGFLKKLVLLHSRESIGIVWNEMALAARWGEAVLLPLKVVNAANWYLVLSLALAGIAIPFRQNGWRALVAQPAVWLWAYFAVTMAVFLGQDRYHIPSIPAIAMLAAYMLVNVYDAWGTPVRGRISSAGRHAPHAGTSPEIAERVEV